MRAVPGARLIDPAVLSRIGNLELIARHVVEGFITGLHHSPHFGMSVDFAEHRPYMPGDDIRRIDWRVFGRTDRHYIKQFEADTNTDFTVVLDTSAPMGFGSRSVSKFDYARYLAACLTYFASKQRDRVGFAQFAGNTVERIPPGAKHLDLVLHALDRAKTHGGGALLQPLRKLSEHMRRRSIIALISDFYEEADAIAEAVRQLRQRGNDVIVFHVLDRAELDFPYEDAMTILDLESGEKLPVVPETLQDEYKELVRVHVDTIGKRMIEHGFDYMLLDTTKPLDHALVHYLSTRERLRSVR
ncbi:MAG TPA: DUF58 domain-containing protein [Longimicrobiales bacterium]